MYILTAAISVVGFKSILIPTYIGGASDLFTFHELLFNMITCHNNINIIMIYKSILYANNLEWSCFKAN